MNKFLSQKEKEDFLNQLKELNFGNDQPLATNLSKIFHCSETTVSTSLTRFPRKAKDKDKKVPAIWKDLIDLIIENKKLKSKFEQIKSSLKV